MNYWKIKAMATALALERERAQVAVDAAVGRFREALKESGLDPDARYRFDDASETLIPVADPATLPQQ